MPALGVGHVNLVVPSTKLEVLRIFYCDVVGLTIGHRPPLERNGSWLYAGARDVLHLTEPLEGEVRQLADGATTYDHLAFQCQDMAASEGWLKLFGVPYRKIRVPEQPKIQLFFRDPLGHGVELEFVADDRTVTR